MKDRDAEQQKTDEDTRERKSDKGCTLHSRLRGTVGNWIFITHAKSFRKKRVFERSQIPNF
jgi:hypothetical protein